MNINVEPELIQYAIPYTLDISNLLLPVSIEIHTPQIAEISEISEIYEIEQVNVNPIQMRRHSHRRNKNVFVNLNICKTICIATLSFMFASFIIHNIT